MGKIPKKIEDTIVGMIHNGHSPEEIIAVNHKYVLYMTYIETLFRDKMAIDEIKNMINSGHSPEEIITGNPEYAVYREHMKQLFTEKCLRELTEIEEIENM